MSYSERLYKDEDGPSPAPLDDESEGYFSERELEEHELLESQDAVALHTRGGWSPSESKRRKRKGKAKDVQQPPIGKRKGGWLRSKACSWFAGLLLVGIIILAALYSSVLSKLYPPPVQSPPWYPAPKGGTLTPWQESYRKAAVMVRNMTLIEKVNVTTGTGWAQDLCVGATAGANIVGFPPLCLQDGPLGIRFADHATAWPAGITVGATWNKDLMYRRGRGLGLEHRLKGVNIMLGPAMGPLGRMPGGGRNWEGFGSDPILQGFAAALTIKGIQDEGVMATAKHYIANEQEHFRQENEWGIPHAISSNIDDRALHEVYLWPFADSIRAGVASVMCSYNMVNNSFACGNSKLQNGILKDELGFQGFIQSDWLAQRSGVASALAGLDMTMPGDGMIWQDGDSLFGSKLTQAVLNGSVPTERIDDMVTRVVASWYQLGQDNKTAWPAPPPDGDGGPNFSSWTDERIGKIHDASDDDTTAVVNKFVDVQGSGEDFHGRLAQEVAAEGTVLVKNIDGILPLSSQGDIRLASTHDDGKYHVGIYGEDAGPIPSGRGPNACADRACNEGTLASGWGSGAVEFPYLSIPIEALESTFDLDAVEITTALTNDLTKDLDEEIQNQDLCIVFVNSDAGEGFHKWRDPTTGRNVNDRHDLHPQKGGDDLVKRVHSNCAQTIVIVHAVGPVILEHWIDLPRIKGVILANLPGEESGNALADVLFGRADASGRLPYTVGKSLEDYGPGGQIMFEYQNRVPQQNFDEGLFIDYRHFDKYNITPRYEFGFGLSYTTFEFSDLSLTTLKSKTLLPSPRPAQEVLPPTYPTTLPDASSAVFPSGFRKLHKYIYPYLNNANDVKMGDYPYPAGYNTPQPLSQAGGGEGGNPSLFEDHILVSVNVTNTGPRTGKQVVQVYVSFPPNVHDVAGRKVEFPVRVLRGFEKVEVGKGETVNVEIRLTRKDLSYWCVVRQNWVMPEEGQFTVSVGTSSRDLRLEAVW